MLQAVILVVEASGYTLDMDIWQAIQTIENRCLDEQNSPDTEYQDFTKAVHFLEDGTNYASLSSSQGNQIARRALDILNKDTDEDTNDIGTTLLFMLATLIPGAIQELHSLLLDRNLGYTIESLYREADSKHEIASFPRSNKEY